MQGNQKGEGIYLKGQCFGRAYVLQCIFFLWAFAIFIRRLKL